MKDFLVVFLLLIVYEASCQLPDPPKTLEELRELAKTSRLSNKLDDDICFKMAQSDKCDTEPKIMLEFCQKSCVDQVEEKSYFRTVHLDPDVDGSFFDLSAKTLQGDTLNFDQFDGFVTTIVNIDIQCKNTDQQDILDRINDLRKMVPNTFQFLLFPFSLTGEDIISDECKVLDKLTEIERTNLRIMTPVKINGQGTHPVYIYLKQKLELNTLEEDQPTWIFVDQMGTRIDAMVGIGLEKLKAHIKEHIQPWEEL
jgi:glutathione peroxidase-family protein